MKCYDKNMNPSESTQVIWRLPGLSEKPQTALSQEHASHRGAVVWAHEQLCLHGRQSRGAAEAVFTHLREVTGSSEIFPFGGKLLLCSPLKESIIKDAGIGETLSALIPHCMLLGESSTGKCPSKPHLMEVTQRLAI